MKRAILTISTIAILFLAWYLILPYFQTVEVNEAPPILSQEEPLAMQNKTSEPKTPNDQNAETPTKTAVFVDADSFHKASGRAHLLTSPDKTYIRFEDFKVTNGPDLFVYLSKDLEASDFVNLGELKGTEGSQNYEIPSNIDPDDYPYALIWCKDFSVLFGSAKF